MDSFWPPRSGLGWGTVPNRIVQGVRELTQYSGSRAHTPDLINETKLWGQLDACQGMIRFDRREALPGNRDIKHYSLGNGCLFHGTCSGLSTHCRFRVPLVQSQGQPTIAAAPTTSVPGSRRLSSYRRLSSLFTSFQTYVAVWKMLSSRQRCRMIDLKVFTTTCEP